MGGFEQLAPEKRSSKSGLAYGLICSTAVLLLLVLPAAFGSRDFSPFAAWMLTFVPGLLVISQAGRFKDPQQAMSFMLLSMGFRILIAFGGGFLVLAAAPGASRVVLFGWLGGLYLAALALEVYLTVSVEAPLSGVRPPASETASTQLRDARR